jgi:hypothetical protein
MVVIEFTVYPLPTGAKKIYPAATCSPAICLFLSGGFGFVSKAVVEVQLI